MKIVPPEPTVDLYKEGFEETDILQRKKTGDALSDLLNRVDEPLVVALDGKWGTGKTYFLKRWAGEHQVAITVYFDAFANDYISDPLPALISALDERTGGLSGPDKDALGKMKKAAFKLARPLVRAGLAAATCGATEILSPVAGAMAVSISSEAADGLQKYWAHEEGRRSAMAEFRKAVKTLARPTDSQRHGATVIFVIDELDRCRPDYALEVLEVIKHLFTVPHLHFVLGVNLQALEAMVRARYGPDIDAPKYLGKFIQVKLELPDEINEGIQQKTILAYLDQLVRDMGIPNHIHGPLQEQIKIVARANHISLRDIGSIVSSVSFANGEVTENDRINPAWIVVMSTLIISRTVRPDLYSKFLYATVTSDDMKSYLGTNEAELTLMSGNNLSSHYKSDVSHLYHLWLFLSDDPGINEYEPEISGRFVVAFSDHGFMPRRKETIPMSVNRKWLDRFSFYTLHQS